MKRIKQHRNKQKKEGIFDSRLFNNFKQMYRKLNWIDKTKINKKLAGETK